MNFEFLRNLRGLGYIYENCTNAEKLVSSMPVQSVFTSRKSAELLAKFIYMAAHNQEMEDLSFADILADPTVRGFVHNRDIMDAFHYIRKSGNRAVHGNDQETSEDAIAVLQDLHYVAGETACMLGLIKNYPDFEAKIGAYPDAVYTDEENINQKAREMFLSYVEEFNAQLERDQYIEMKDYDWFTYSIESNVEMHEYLEFKYRPKQLELIEYLQSYLSTLLRLSVERSPEKAEEIELSYPVTLDAKLIIGQKQYSSQNTEDFVLALAEELPKAEGFTIDLVCNGVLRELFNDELDEEGNGRLNMIRKDAVWTGTGMFDTLEAYKRRNAFTYKLAVFYPDSGEFKYEKILNGKEIDVLDNCTPKILEKAVSQEWWSYNLDLWAEFDVEKYANKLSELRNIVRANIPQSEVRYCEGSWADGESHILCSSIQWNTHNLNDVQHFLDKINIVLLPIKDEVEAGGEGTWEIKDDFAVATWDWTDEGFKVKGICY